MKKSRKSFLLAMMAILVAAGLAGCGRGNSASGQQTENANGQTDQLAQAQTEDAEKDSVIVVMGPSSEPEAGFDPVYGWGAGEHVHEPLIQSTLTVTNKDLTIGYDLATDMETSEDGMTWTVTIRSDVKFTDGEALTAEDVAFTYNTLRDNSTVNDFTSDVRVRRAINLGIDREEMIQHVLNGYGSPAYSVCDKMPWYNEASETSYDPEAAKTLLEEAGWTEGKDGIREKDGVQAGFTLMYPASDSVRQALAADTANQLKELGIQVSIEGVGWDTAYDRAQSTPLMWGWGAHTPMEFYNIYHTAQNSSFAEYSPYSNEKVDEYMDQALASPSLEESYDLWKKAQWDGENGVTQEGDIPWIWLVNIDHLYWSRKGLHVADQKLHPHGHGWSIVNNVDQWTWE